MCQKCNDIECSPEHYCGLAKWNLYDSGGNLNDISDFIITTVKEEKLEIPDSRSTCKSCKPSSIKKTNRHLLKGSFSKPTIEILCDDIQNSLNGENETYKTLTKLLTPEDRTTINVGGGINYNTIGAYSGSSSYSGNSSTLVSGYVTSQNCRPL